MSGDDPENLEALFQRLKEYCGKDLISRKEGILAPIIMTHTPTGRLSIESMMAHGGVFHIPLEMGVDNMPHLAPYVACTPPEDNLFQRMGDQIDAENKQRLESGLLPPHEAALVEENLYPERFLGRKIQNSGMFGQFDRSYMVSPKHYPEQEPEQVGIEEQPKKKTTPPSPLLMKLMGRLTVK